MNPATFTQPTNQLRYAAFTHPGKLHRRNQDAILIVDRVLQTADFVHGSLPLDGTLRFAVSDGVSGNPQRAAASIFPEKANRRTCMIPRSHTALARRQATGRLGGNVARYPKLEDAASTLVTAEAKSDAA